MNDETTNRTSDDAGTVNVEAIRNSIDARFDTAVEQLKELVSIPGIAWDAFDAQELNRSAEAVAEAVRNAGISDVRILRVDHEGVSGGPAVVARRPAQPDKPTVLLYAHHDVQPPGDAGAWESDPFLATQRGERLFGRGAADDKAGIMAHIGAIQALGETIGDNFGVGVTLFIEGEEEAGSPTFRQFLHEHRELLAADVIVVADSSNWKVGVPALTTSLRGLVDGTIEVEVLEHAVHSGMFGGPVLDAPTLLSRLIATLHDENGSVAVAGLASSQDTTVEYPEADYRKDASVLDGVELAGTGPLASRLWTQPALSIIGIDAPSVATSSNTLLPRARAKFSLRLAPGSDPDEAMEAVRSHVQRQAPFGARVTFTPGETGKAFATNTAEPAAQHALWALEQAWSVPPVESGVGGSIPFIADLTDVYPDAQILVTGVEDPDSRAHSANESLHLGEFRKAMLAEALMLARINSAGL
ncbi:dipeptidase [Arthrobacter pigmenti]